MDIIINFVTDLRNLFGLSLPLFLGIYSLVFLNFYFFGINRINTKINFSLLIVFGFIIFILGNLKAENSFTNYLISTSDNSLGGTFGQKFQSGSIFGFYFVSIFFVISIIFSVSPKIITKFFTNIFLIAVMIITLGSKTLFRVLRLTKSESVIVSQNTSPQTIITKQLDYSTSQTQLVSESIDLDEQDENQNHLESKDSNVQYNSNWSQNKKVSNNDSIIKHRDNSTSYFDNKNTSIPTTNTVIPKPKNITYDDSLSSSLPSIDLLNDLKEVSISQNEIDETADNIKKTLNEYDVEVEIGQVQPGPVVTLYGLIPGWIKKTKKEKQFDTDGNPLLDDKGKHILKETERRNRVKVDSIFAREKDLSLALKTPSIRIETPVLGESLVGIEVPNPNPGMIGVKSLLSSDTYKDMMLKNDSLPIALGKGSGGDNISIDLTKMPHLLIAGATGSGKSVCMNSIVSSLIYSKTPDQLRLMLVDPKRVELTQYNGIPHMISPVIVELDSVAKIFRGVINEMFKRYKLMESKSVRNISELNKKFPNSMPYLVIVIDELADLMMTSGAEIERSICRLAQLGRATGIHLVVATQRPSVDVVTGLIKSNFPSRISFSVSSSIDSRTILDTTGAEKLLGKGDMLYLPVDGAVPSRLQGCFINDDEISNLVNFWTNHNSQNYNYQINIFENLENDQDEVNSNLSGIDRDSLFNDAVSLAKATKKLSISLLQRKLRIGYPRAARLMDELEEEGIVGPQQESAKSRDVIIS